MRKREPTNGSNATSRLFLRFFLCYLLTAPVAVLCAMRGLLDLIPQKSGTVEFFFIPFALLGAFLTVTKPYLIILTVIKSFYDVTFLYQVSQWVFLGAIGILPWNACFFILIFSMILFSVPCKRSSTDPFPSVLPLFA